MLIPQHETDFKKVQKILIVDETGLRLAASSPGKHLIRRLSFFIGYGIDIAI